jgi:uncharacterized phage-associated protein
MANVFDTAAYVLERCGPMTTMKLQKIVYYCQAWHIAWTDDVLFNERIEAWVDGPVSPDLFRHHRGSFRISSIDIGNSARLTKQEKKTIDKVTKFYGNKSPQWLIDLTHQEDPWRQARAGLPDGVGSNREIKPEAMGRYYSSL